MSAQPEEKDNFYSEIRPMSPQAEELMSMI